VQTNGSAVEPGTVCRVLIVDDNATNREILLQAAGGVGNAANRHAMTAPLRFQLLHQALP
jgi:CheY-like chemotaxis protein